MFEKDKIFTMGLGLNQNNVSHKPERCLKIIHSNASALPMFIFLLLHFSFFLRLPTIGSKVEICQKSFLLVNWFYIILFFCPNFTEMRKKESESTEMNSQQEQCK
jgi:hypothetical protein